MFFWVLVVNCIVLGWCGANVPEGFWLVLSRITTAYYFLHFLVLVPLIGLIEKPRPLPHSISQSVLKPSKPHLQSAAVAAHAP